MTEPTNISPLFLWNQLTQLDRDEYLRIRTTFQLSPKITSRDRRIHTFPRDLNIAVNFIESSPDNANIRAILVGLCFVGPIVCINTQRLKEFTNRCKSAVNGSFQQLGYIAFRSKSKARECVLTSLPVLHAYPEIIRQWTARAVSNDTTVCFLSSFSREKLPEIVPEDLLLERKERKVKERIAKVPRPDLRFPQMTSPSLSPEQFEYLSDWMPEIEANWDVLPIPNVAIGSGAWFDDIMSGECQ
jgi:hypothetical protein